MENFDQEAISTFSTMNEKSKPLWSRYHKLNRRDKKALKETLDAKEKEIINYLINERLDYKSLKNDNLYEKYLDEEMQIVSM